MHKTLQVQILYGTVRNDFAARKKPVDPGTESKAGGGDESLAIERKATGKRSELAPGEGRESPKHSVVVM